MSLHGPYLAQLHQRLPERFLAQFPSATSGTVTVSFTPQGSLPWLPKNVDTDYLIICGLAGTSVQSGRIYQLANEKKIMPLSPSSAKSLLFRRKAMNPWTLALDVGTAASLALPVLGQSGVISMSSKWAVATLSGHAVFDYVQGQVQSRIPDPAPTIDLLLDPNNVLIFTGSCIEATMATRHVKRPVSGTFQVQ